ncbi:MAG: hypothetical protein HQ528_00100 [Candidatus Marinimicrobia bacterium]|nr:hypothetical protein [Candidatus Neomarinimicrobiota bacterium]
MKILSISIPLLIAATVIFAGQPSIKKVFVVFSYHSEFSWVIDENKGITKGFAGNNIELELFYMDTKRKTSPEWKQAITDKAIASITVFKPDVLMVFDDNACEWVAKHYAGSTLPVVFAGMNFEPAHYGFPTANITGVVEHIPLKAMIDLVTELDPTVRKVAFISDDSPTSSGIDERLPSLNLPVEILEVVATNDFDEWKTKIMAWQDQVDAIGIFNYNTLKDAEGTVSMPPSNVMQWINENNKLPEFASFDFAVKDGALCSAYKAGNTQGRVAAEIVLKILTGTAPADLKITDPPESVRIVNKARAKQLGIEMQKDADYRIIE